MNRLRGPWPVVSLTAFGFLLGLLLIETGARIAAVVEERHEGRFDRDLERARNPSRGRPVTLGQMIRRSANPRIVYELKPGLDVVFAGARVTTSDAGFRGRSVPHQKAKDAFRIIGLGDSYMFGQGVADDETYLAQLPGRWPRRKVEIANLAVPGYNTVMEVETLRERGPSLYPDLILIEIVGNDLDLPNFLWKTVDPWAWNRSFLLDFVRARLGATSMPPDPAEGLAEAPREGAQAAATFSRTADHVPDRYASLVGPPAFERAVADLAAFGREHGVEVLALTHGVWFEKEMTDVLARNDIPLLILRSALRRQARSLGAPDYARSPLAQSPTDLHPSALGHQVIAQEVGAWIEERLPAAVGAGDVDHPD